MAVRLSTGLQEAVAAPAPDEHHLGMPTPAPVLLELHRLRQRQDGVVSRRQLVDVGAAEHDLERWRHRRLLRTVHRGVYVDHTGPLTFRQRAWAAVLAVGDAAVYGPSALRLAYGAGRRDLDEDGPIHVAVDHARRVEAPEGVVVHRVRGLDARVRWAANPPVVRVEEALLDLAQSARSDHDAIALLADGVQARLTTVARLSLALQRRARVRRRTFLTAVLADVEAGVCSTLEAAYVTRVERAHGLPPSERQQPTGVGRPGFRDVTYRRYGVNVELDGRLGHTHHDDLDRDLERDLAAATRQEVTLRLGWGQSVGRPCATSRTLALILQAQGWDGEWHPCPDCRE